MYTLADEYNSGGEAPPSPYLKFANTYLTWVCIFEDFIVFGYGRSSN